jgi:hypothetical protein
MKRILIILVLCLSLCGCSDEKAFNKGMNDLQSECGNLGGTVNVSMYKSSWSMGMNVSCTYIKKEVDTGNSK